MFPNLKRIFLISNLGWALCCSASELNKNILTLRLAAEPATLDWNIAHTSYETYILMNLMEGLTEFDETARVRPGLAESWKVSGRGRVYTFKLRKGLKWSDGQPLRASDFAFGWQRLLNPATGASYAYFLFDVEGAEEFNRGQLKDFSKVGIRALDDRTFQVKLKRPVAHWLQIPAFWVTFPLRRDLVEKYGASWTLPGKMQTVGPFNLESYDIGSKLILKRNPHYFRQSGNVDRVVGLIVTDASAALNLYESGKIDFINDLSSIDLKQLASHPDMKTFPYLKTGYIGFTVGNTPVNDVRVRRAISQAIDREKIGGILYGGQKAATTFVPPPLFAHSPRIGLKFDPAQAKKELQAAGYGPKRPLRLEILTLSSDKTLVLTQYIQAQLATHLGAQVSIQAYDHKTFQSQSKLRTVPLFLLSWGADYPDPDNFLSLFLGSSGNNRTGWASKEYDQMITGARSEMSQPRRKALYERAQKLLLEKEAVTLPLYYEPNKAMIKPRVKGLRLNPLNFLILRDVDVQS